MSHTRIGCIPPVNQHPFKRSILLIFFTLAFLAGNLVLQQFTYLPSGFIVLVFTILYFLVCFLYVRFSIGLRFGVKWRPRFFITALLLAGFFFGFSRAWVQAEIYLSNSAPADLISEDLVIPACVSTLPQRDGDISRFVIRPIGSLQTNVNKIRVSASLRNQDFPEFRAGSCWNFSLRMKTTRGLRNNNSFDYELWLYQKKIGATAYLRAKPVPLQMQAYPWLRYRAQLAGKIKSVLPQDSIIQPLILGLSLGIRDELTSEQWSVLQKTGTTHLLAISGLHIGIAALFGFYIGKLGWFLFALLGYTRALSRKIMPMQCGLFFAVVFAIIYAALAGFSVPTQRACVMLLVAALAMAGSRSVQVTSVLCVALLGVLIIDPIASLASGTWLSFLAVIILVVMAGRDKKISRHTNKLLVQSHKIITLGRLQFVLVLILSVPVAFSFSQVSLISPLVNFVLIPVFSFSVVPVLLLAVFVLNISDDLAACLLNFEHQWLDLIWQVLALCANFPMASSEMQVNLSQSVLLMILMLPFFLPKPVLSRWYSSTILLSLFFGYANRTDENILLNMQVYDVGQGLAVLMQTREHQLLYDTGPAFRSGSSAAERVLLPEFSLGGISQISMLVISHTDNDHAGGLDVLTGTLNPKQIFSPEKDPVKNSSPCVAGTSWEWDQVKFEFIYPFKNTQSSNKNNYSCVLKVSLDEHDILLTGDIEKAAEYALLTRYDNLQTETVFAPHHGSRSSSTHEFINAVAAKQVIFPAGFANRWRFPKTDILDRWSASGSVVYNIARTGQLEFNFTQDKSVQINTWIAQKCHYWHQDCD